MEKFNEVECQMVEKDGIIMIHFPKFTKIYDFGKFITINGLENKKVIFSPRPIQKAKIAKLKIPVIAKFELMKKLLQEKGLI